MALWGALGCLGAVGSDRIAPTAAGSAGGEREIMAHILIAEDDASLRTFLTAALRRAGHDVEAVGDGNDGLDRLQAGRYDLLLADIVMPGLDGIELSRRAKTLCPDIRVMFITGFAAIAMGHDPADGSVAHVLSKPFHLRELVDQVESILAEPAA